MNSSPSYRSRDIWNLCVTSLVTLGTIGLPFVGFIVLKMVQQSENYVREENVLPPPRRPTAPPPKPYTTKVDRGIVLTRFFDRKRNTPKIRYLVATYGDRKLGLEGISSLLQEFFTLFEEDELKAGSEPSPEPSAAPSAHPTETANVSPTSTPVEILPADEEESGHSQWYTNDESPPFIMFTRLAVFSAVALAGAIGATLSLLTRPRREQDPLVTVRNLTGMQLVGAVFAVVLSLVFAGGFIGGALFPDGGPGSWFIVIYLHSQFAKLLVWSFIAGFFERLMPGIFRTFANRLESGVREDSGSQGSP